MFKRMQMASERMQLLIENLLAFARLGTSERKFEKVDFKTIIDRTKKELEDSIVERQAIIEVKESCEVKVIPFQFNQLMYNLISNALKFSNPAIPPRIIVDCRNITSNEAILASLAANKEYCRITITDNGIGFEKKYREKIFEVFQKLHGKEEFSGTGIGLAIVKKIVENHNGFISATSELNEGATFEIYIPA